MLALPLTAVVLLRASPTQMGMLTAMEVVPFVLFSLPAGVWLDRVRKLPVHEVGDSVIAVAVTSVPLAWWFGVLSIDWLIAIAFVLGTVNTIGGSAARIVRTQIVPSEGLLEAHARKPPANSS